MVQLPSLKKTPFSGRPAGEYRRVQARLFSNKKWFGLYWKLSALSSTIGNNARRPEDRRTGRHEFLLIWRVNGPPSKKAEKEDSWIVRIVETHGRNSKGTLKLKGAVTECNLIEWENLGEPKSVENELALDLSPFEVKTYKVRFA